MWIFACFVDAVRIRGAVTGASKVWKGLLMAKVKYIASPNELPAGQNYVLVMYGKEYAQMRNPLGVTITVARQESKTVSELSFLTAVHTARGIAKQEKISEIFVCTATTSWPAPIIPYSPAVGNSNEKLL